MNVSVMVLVVMSSVGIIFGLVLAFANKKFAVDVNPLIHLVEEALPKGQCGACGYAGCMAYAEAVVIKPEVAPNLCIPGKASVAKVVSELTGKTAAIVEPKVAVVRCMGDSSKTIQSYNYEGIKDCAAASMLQGGPKGCKNGCVGFGNCVNVCHFNALHMGENGLPFVDKSRCTGCGSCITACPKNVIEMVPANYKAEVFCNSKNKGQEARKLCTSACIGCGICSRACMLGAITIENNLAVVDEHICITKCMKPTCIDKCPTGAIKVINNMKLTKLSKK